MIKIVVGRPPNFDAILAAFPMAKTQGVIFTYGETIFNPGGKEIAPWIIAHERVHTQQQGDDVEGWWRKYIDDPKFRFAQELEAHRVEWRTWLGARADFRPRSRVERRGMMAVIASRLAGPIYGRMVDFSTARRMIEAD